VAFAVVMYDKFNCFYGFVWITELRFFCDWTVGSVIPRSEGWSESNATSIGFEDKQTTPLFLQVAASGQLSNIQSEWSTAPRKTLPEKIAEHAMPIVHKPGSNFRKLGQLRSIVVTLFPLNLFQSATNFACPDSQTRG